VQAAAPGHAATVLATVVDPLTADDVADLDRIMGRVLEVLDPAHIMVDLPAADD
jgi:hypothetical protein